MSADPEPRTVIVTGASSGIGAGVARAFGAAGDRVVVNCPGPAEARAAEAVAEDVRRAGGEAMVFQADVADEAAVAALVTTAEETFGVVDVLVNNAGIASVAPIEALSLDAFERVVAVHLRGTFLTIRAVLPSMYARDTGIIINTASQLAYKGAAGLAHYTAAKGAIVSLTRSLALEVGTRGVRVNCVAPGATMTPMLDAVPETALDAIRQSIPRGRIAEVDDIVPCYLFLASDGARHLQGQCLSPNGGDVFL